MAQLLTNSRSDTQRAFRTTEEHVVVGKNKAIALTVRLVAVAAAYYVTARFGLSVGSLPGNVSPVWPPTGLAIASVFIFGPSVAPGVWLGAFLINLDGGHLYVALALATGNMLEALAGGRILRRFGLSPTLSHPRDIAVLAAGAGLVATLISATVGVLTLHAAGITPAYQMLESWRVWWIGDALGAVIVTPFLLAWHQPAEEPAVGSRIEAASLGLALVIAFAVSSLGSQPSAFLVFPVVAWAGLRFGARGASLVALVTTVIAVLRTAAGVGRFVTGDPVTDLYLIDTFLGVLSITGLLLAAVVSERGRVQCALVRANSELEARVAERTNALRVDRFRLEQAQRVAGIGSWELHLHDNTISGSAQLDRIFNVEQGLGAVPYSVYWDKFVEDDRVALNDAMRVAEASGGSFSIDVRMLVGDGTHRWLRITGEPGDVAQMHGSAQDITDAKAKEDVIRANEERAAAIVDASSEAFISMILDEGITDWNGQAERTFGWRKEEVLGRSLVDTIIPESMREAHRVGVERFLKTGQAQVLNTRRELTALHRDGHEFPVEMAVWMTRDSAGGAVFHAYMHDISERQADKAKLAFALEEAREASRMKSAFLANMSHEIRTPMNGVLGMVGFLLDTELDEVQRDYVQTMAFSAESLMAIIDDILDVSKIEAGKLEIEQSDFDLRRVLQDTLRPFMPAANEKGVALGATVSNSIPDGVRGDRLRLRQVISNLVANAVKFTAIGSVNVCVRLWDDKLLFEVTDSGIGIPEDRRSQLFEPFTQADASTTRRYGGTGLGLAICRQLVTLMGGDIGVTSAQGGGSRFWFSIPMVVAAAIDVPVVTERDKGVLRSSGQGRTVLVVEDNPVNRKVAVGMLEHLGYAVEIAVDGVEAASLFAPGTFDAILMDCQMPRMDGYDATRAIRAQENTCHTPIIAMTASAMASDRDKCLAAGMDDFLSKPIGTEKLGATLNNWISETTTTEAPAAPTDVAPFDDEVAEHLRSLDDDGTFLLDLLTMFRDDSQKLLQQLQDAITAGDTKTVKGLAHQLKGSTGLLGLRALSAACATLEHEDSLAAAAAHIGHILTEYELALVYVGELAARTAA